MEISQVFCQLDKKNMPAKYLSLEKEKYIFKKIDSCLMIVLKSISKLTDL